MSVAACWFVNSAQVEMEQETQVIARGLRRRDPEILDQLIERYQYRLFRYLIYLVGNQETAEDLFQETWVRVLERGRQYDAKSKFEPWLFTIARHLVIDFQRRRRFHSEDLIDMEKAGVSELAPIVNPQVSALELVARTETSEQLGAALGSLSTPYREVLLLRFQEDMGLEEIAQVVEAPLSTVKSRLYRGLDAMRQLLAGGPA